MTIEQKRALLVTLQQKAVALDSKAKQENRDLTVDEQKEFDSIFNESDSLRAEIVNDEERAAKLAGLNSYLNEPVTPQQQVPAVEVPSNEAYRSVGEWMNAERRSMSMGNAGSGGIIVPEQFREEILSMGLSKSIVRQRAMVIPAGDPPDAKITIPMLNQGSNGIYAGMDMVWIDEGGTKADTTPKFSSVELEPKELGGSTIITDKLLRNAPALSAWLKSMFESIVTGKEDYQFLRGNGVGCPIGILGCAAEKEIIRTTASAIVFDDIANMLTAFLADSWGKGVWVANQSIIPQLLAITDSAGNSLFIQGDVTKGISSTLFGIPIVFNGKTPVLGSKGDLMLCDMSYYIIKDGSGPYFATSEHVYFTTNKTVVKMFKLVDGAPWVKVPLLLEDATTTVSPFVALK